MFSFLSFRIIFRSLFLCVRVFDVVVIFETCFPVVLLIATGS